MTQLQPPCHGVPRVREEPYSNVLLRSLGKRLLPNDHLSWRIYADGPPSCSLQSSVPLRSPLFGFGLGPLEIDAQEVDDPEQQSEERNRSQYFPRPAVVIVVAHSDSSSFGCRIYKRSRILPIASSNAANSHMKENVNVCGLFSS